MAKKTVTLSLTLLLFTGCSGVVTHGFDDESALYSGPSKANKSQPQPSQPEPKTTETEESETTVEYNRFEGE